MNPALRFSILALLASTHGVNDFIAGWMLGGGMPGASAWDRLPWLAIYAALAFGGQLPVAWLMDRSPRRYAWLMGAIVTMIAAVAAWKISPGVAVILSGVASAFCHVAGGAIALHLPRGERALGWFSAPGVVGLTLGGWLGSTQGELAPWAALLPIALLCGCLSLRDHWPRQEAAENRVPVPGIDAHDGLMLLILLALTLRSAVWDLVQIARSADAHVLFALAASAALGKVLGGWMISRWPTVRHVSITLIVSCLLLEFARQSIVGLCAGVALLQSTIPASIVILHRSFGTSAERATAYVLGLTVALGGLVIPLHFDITTSLIAVTAAAVALLWWTSRISQPQPIG
jgi:MFS family permease